MRFNHVIAVAFILVLVGAKLTFFAAPIAEADARSIASGSVDVFQIHQAVGLHRQIRHAVAVFL